MSPVPSSVMVRASPPVPPVSVSAEVIESISADTASTCVRLVDTGTRHQGKREAVITSAQRRRWYQSRE